MLIAHTELLLQIIEGYRVLRQNALGVGVIELILNFVVITLRV